MASDGGNIKPTGWYVHTDQMVLSWLARVNVPSLELAVFTIKGLTGGNWATPDGGLRFTGHRES